MFRRFIPLLKPIYNQRSFSSCNNRCKVDEVTSNLVRQEYNLNIIDKKIGILTIMSFVNIIFSIIF